MYDICMNVIMSGRFELSGMLRKLDVLWLQGQISDEQKKELIELARKHADPAVSENLAAEVDELAAAFDALRKRVEKLEKGSGSGGGEPAEDYPEYIVGKRYRTGDKVSFQGNRYQCIAPEGQVCVWSPSDYPAYWQQVV